MKKLLLIAFALYANHKLYAQTGVSDIIPAPLHAEEAPGFFTITRSIKVNAAPLFKEPAALLASQLGLPLQTAQKSGAAGTTGKIVFATALSDDTLGAEGYRLHITPSLITITAAAPAGALKGLFSLLQLQQLQADQQKIPCGSITDKPRFAYRGLHLDVSRNFFPLDFIRKFIDLMALYKFNTFHWHLTDGPGWRLQIKKYPLLTKMAAYRNYNYWKPWWENGRKYSFEGEPGAYGGFYTQEEAKEIVAFAAKRGITVIPEIEMPAHSEEVLAAYPQLSCSGLPYKNSELCIGNDSTFTFLQDVLTEVMDIFPSTYIHLGGDEASTAAWKACPKCQHLKTTMGFSNEHELQSYLMKKMQLFLAAHKRKAIGWDEIMEGGTPPGTTIMNWRNEKYGITAAENGHDVIMTPGSYYLDAYQSDPKTQPEAIGGYLPLDKLYNYEPVPSSVDPTKKTHYIGIQGCIWAEYMPTTYQVEYMAFPRAIALAETAWTAKEKKNLAGFQQRLQYHYLLLQRRGVNYYRPSNFITVNAAPDTIKKQDLVSFTSEQYQPEIRYTIDNSIPVAGSPLYTGPFYTNGKTIINAAIFKNGIMAGEASTATVNYHRAIGKKVTFNKSWSDSYPAQGESTLTNGIEGSITYSDKQWLGYLNDFDVTVDMESVSVINTISIRFMQQPGPGFFVTFLCRSVRVGRWYQFHFIG